MSYVRALTICLLLVYFVSAAGCHYFDLPIFNALGKTPVLIEKLKISSRYGDSVLTLSLRILFGMSWIPVALLFISFLITFTIWEAAMVLNWNFTIATLIWAVGDSSVKGIFSVSLLPTETKCWLQTLAISPPSLISLPLETILSILTDLLPWPIACFRIFQVPFKLSLFSSILSEQVFFSECEEFVVHSVFYVVIGLSERIRSSFICFSSEIITLSNHWF